MAVSIAQPPSRPSPSRGPATRGSGRRASGEAGFTLLELLVSLTIVAILALAQAAPFQRTLSSREHAEQAMERSNAARLTLQRLAEELSGAVPLRGERGRFVLIDRTFDRPASELSFTTTTARKVRAGPQDPFEVVRYRVEAGDPDARGALLVKEQLPSVATEGTPFTANVVLEDVVAFTVRVLPERGEWLATWQGGEGGVRIPRAVELQLTLADGSADPPVYRLLVDLPMGGSTKP
ncbi:MAG: prepilin-type N-terminal cleavage/methylation domain-containing protein [Deltaproteobacteria bacterium]|nr:prepilin-type N-terminal cleavage/methylation domain-containing protein [Deltaproteobacteria bacterium]